MAILKRFEIWLLLFLVVGVVVFVVKNSSDPKVAVVESPPEEKTLIQPTTETDTETQPEGGNDDGIPELPAVSDSQVLRVEKVVSTNTGNGHIVDLLLAGRSGTDEEVLLDAAKLTVRTPEGDELPRFFTPFHEDPVLDPKEETLVTLQYWSVDTPESLWVEYRDQRIKADIPR